MKSFVLKNIRLLDAATGTPADPVSIRIEDGKITELSATVPEEKATVWEGGGGGALASAGWTDLFADYREPGEEYKETVETGLAAAAAGGFTQVGLLPNTLPVADHRGAVEQQKARAAGSPVRLLPYGALSQGLEGKTLAEMIDMRAGGAAAFTDGWKPVQRAGLLLKALEYVKSFEGTILQIPNDESLSAGGLMHEGLMSTRLGMAGIPPGAETTAVYRDLELLRYTGSRLHLTGISTATSVALIREAKKEGLNISCSVMPAHLLLTDAALHTYDSAWKLSPPLRPESDRQALIAGLADGTIDAVASHHRPQDWDAKNKEFEYAGTGLALQEILFPLLLKAVGDAVPLHRLVDALSGAPRRILGLPPTTIAAGQPAEITLFSTEGETLIARESARSKAWNNPFLGEALPGRVLGIFTPAGHTLPAS